jgi:hypothetical protein
VCCKQLFNTFPEVVCAAAISDLRSPYPDFLKICCDFIANSLHRLVAHKKSAGKSAADTAAAEAAERRQQQS